MKLWGLGLAGTKVTDVGLKGLPNLGGLELNSTQVTDAGVAELQQALANVEISR